MLRSLLARYFLILLNCSCIGLVHAATGTTNQMLQEEIKQSEANASQAVLDVLQANVKPDPDQNQTPSKAAVATPKPSSNTSNTDRAFTPTDNAPASSSHSSNKNPWLQPNPWAKQSSTIWEKNAKVNPYANAAIPGPTPSNPSIPSPPNIFVPSRPTHSNNP